MDGKKLKRLKVTDIAWGRREIVNKEAAYVPFNQLPTEAEVLIEDVPMDENADEETRQGDLNWIMDEIESSLAINYGWKVLRYTYTDIFGNWGSRTVTEPFFI